jgi:arylsulfatase A-like enzyme
MGFWRLRGMPRVGALALLVHAILVAAVVVSAAAESTGPPPREGRPNILVLFSDDQRADTIAALGNPNIRTPNLDRLVRRGTAFTRAYCMGSLQGAVCVPSRAMLFSGRTLFHAKGDLAGQTTWPESFAKAGYTTFLTGKWHNQAKSALRSFDQGKAVFLGGMGDPYKLPLQDISPQHTFVNRRQSGEHSVKLFADAAVEFLRGQTDPAPFLCCVAFNSPHDPREAPQSFHRWYNAHQPPLPLDFMPRHPFDNGEMEIRDEKLCPWPRTPDAVRQHLSDYYACIEFLDEQVGRILAALEATGRLENTLIVFAADHGLAIGSHGLFGKQNLYEHSMRSPLLIAGPGISEGKRVDALCYLLDIFPTLGDLADVKRPDGSEGRTLAPILAGRQSFAYGSIFTAYAGVQRAVCDQRWKLIVYPKIDKSQLFDLQSDPDEMHDLATDPNHASERNRLGNLLQEWQKRLDDPQPLANGAAERNSDTQEFRHP